MPNQLYQPNPFLSNDFALLVVMVQTHFFTFCSVTLVSLISESLFSVILSLLCYINNFTLLNVIQNLFVFLSNYR